jgi:type II secretory pathway component HofQ
MFFFGGAFTQCSFVLNFDHLAKKKKKKKKKKVLFSKKSSKIEKNLLNCHVSTTHKKIEKINTMDQVMHEKVLNLVSYTLNVHQFTYFL